MFCHSVNSAERGTMQTDSTSVLWLSCIDLTFYSAVFDAVNGHITYENITH